VLHDLFLSSNNQKDPVKEVEMGRMYGTHVEEIIAFVAVVRKPEEKI
jgi:hypothetical protein